MIHFHAPDLTQYPPRSDRVRIGGSVILARMLDKGRATLVGTNGDYHYDCPVDKRFLEFAGIDADPLNGQLAAGAGDGQILEWIHANSTTKPSGPTLQCGRRIRSSDRPAILSRTSSTALCIRAPARRVKTS